MKFEENLNKLNALVRRMESGTMNIDDTIKAFEEGRALVETCRAELEAIRLKIDLVTSSGVKPVDIVDNAAGERDIAL